MCSVTLEVFWARHKMRLWLSGILLGSVWWYHQNSAQQFAAAPTNLDQSGYVRVKNHECKIPPIQQEVDKTNVYVNKGNKHCKESRSLCNTDICLPFDV